MKHTRRLFLRALGTGAVAIPMSILVRQGAVIAGDRPKLDPEEEAAKALGYVLESSNAKRCSDCQLYRGGAGSKWGRCAIFGAKLVNANGWCYSWSA